MIGSTIFIAGVYGTGKSTLCSALSARLSVLAFSAGDLISAINGEQYGSNKAVTNKDNNQVLLAARVRELNRKYKRIILAGHFCIFNSDNGIEVLPESVYSALNISQVILLEANVQKILEHLHRRDGKDYPAGSISTLLIKEREQSERIAKQLNCPLDIYKMTFTEEDTDYIASLLTEED